MGDWAYGALRVTATTAVALVSSSDGVTALCEFTPGCPPDWHHLADEWIVVDPDRRLSILTESGTTYLLTRCRGAVLYRLPLDLVGFPAYFANTLSRVDGHPAVLTATDDTITFDHLLTGEEVHVPWQAPPGWTIDEVVSVRDRPYAWLERQSDHWQGWLWDPVANRPVRPPLRLAGYRWPLTGVCGRPAVLTMTNWRTYEVWDLALNAPIGPALPPTTPTLATPSLGTLHGRPTLTAWTAAEIRSWDLLTGHVVRSLPTPTEPLSTVIGPTNTVHILDADANLTTHPLPLRTIHPLTQKSE